MFFFFFHKPVLQYNMYSYLAENGAFTPLNTRVALLKMCCVRRLIPRPLNRAQDAEAATAL